MIRRLERDGQPPTTFEKIELYSYSFTCDGCGVLMATCFDWGFRDDYAIEDKKVQEMVMYCGACKLDDVDE